MARILGSEKNRVNILRSEWSDGTTTMAADWDWNGGPVGVWVRYDPQTSHKEAFSMLMQGLWEAMQDPSNFSVEQTQRGEMEIEPYWDGVK